MLQPGTRLGDYLIIDVIQNSRKEVVYRVRNLLANRLEAMKLLPEPLERDDDARERFFREIKVLARLVHPNIVTFFHAAQIDGRMIMTTELLEGMTLSERLEAGPIPTEETVSILAQVLTALAYAHSQSVVHREVTPGNIWLLAGGKVKLGGFALAKAKGDMRLTQEGMSLGEVHYMAPEQVKGVGTLDYRADLYAVGCTLYEMLAGRRPFEAKSQFDVMLAHVQRQPTPVTMVNPKVPIGSHALLEKALAKDPADRFRSALAFHEAIVEALLGQFPATAKMPDRPETRPVPALQVDHHLAGDHRKTATAAAFAAPPRATDGLLTWLVVATLVVTVLWVAQFFVK